MYLFSVFLIFNTLTLKKIAIKYLEKNDQESNLILFVIILCYV